MWPLCKLLPNIVGMWKVSDHLPQQDTELQPCTHTPSRSKRGWTSWLASSPSNTGSRTAARRWRRLQHGVKSPLSITAGPQKRKPPHAAGRPSDSQDGGTAAPRATRASPCSRKMGRFLKREGVTARQSRHQPPARDKRHHFYPFLLRLHKRDLIKLAHLTDISHIESLSGSNFSFFLVWSGLFCLPGSKSH